MEQGARSLEVALERVARLRVGDRRSEIGEQIGSDFPRITAAIEDAVDDRLIFRDLLINRVGKSRGECTMKLEVHRVNSRLKLKRVDVRIEAVEKVVADAGLL